MSTPTLISFSVLPLGTRFRYPGEKRIFTVLSKHREIENGPMHGTIAQWEADMLTYGNWPGQQIFAHIPGECPDIVEAIN
jgi:hypothetical protein